MKLIHYIRQGYFHNNLKRIYDQECLNTVFIVINAPGRCIFQKGGATIADKQNHISSPVAMGDNGHLMAHNKTVSIT